VNLALIPNAVEIKCGTVINNKILLCLIDLLYLSTYKFVNLNAALIALKQVSARSVAPNKLKIYCITLTVVVNQGPVLPHKPS